MEESIKRAIEGGYTYNCGKGLFTKGDGMECVYSGVNSEWTVWTRKDNDSSICVAHEDTLLDPEFWRALGKAKGWKTAVYNGYAGTVSEIKESWLYYWHRFIDALSEGQTPDDFFKELLK